MIPIVHSVFLFFIFFLFQFSFVSATCDINCNECISNECLSCQSGYALNPNRNTCDSCSVQKNCKDCHYYVSFGYWEIYCDACEDGYYQPPFFSTPYCSQCKSNCSSCRYYEQCDICQKDYQLSQSSGSCSKQMSGFIWFLIIGLPIILVGIIVFFVIKCALRHQKQLQIQRIEDAKPSFGSMEIVLQDNSFQLEENIGGEVILEIEQETLCTYIDIILEGRYIVSTYIHTLYQSQRDMYGQYKLVYRPQTRNYDTDKIIFSQKIRLYENPMVYGGGVDSKGTQKFNFNFNNLPRIASSEYYYTRTDGNFRVSAEISWKLISKAGTNSPLFKKEIGLIKNITIKESNLSEPTLLLTEEFSLKKYFFECSGIIPVIVQYPNQINSGPDFTISVSIMNNSQNTLYLLQTCLLERAVVKRYNCLSNFQQQQDQYSVDYIEPFHPNSQQTTQLTFQPFQHNNFSVTNTYIQKSYSIKLEFKYDAPFYQWFRQTIIIPIKILPFQITKPEENKQDF